MRGHDRSPSSLVGWAWNSTGMARLLAKTGFLSLSWCETPLDLAAGEWEVGLQPGEGESVTALTPDTRGRESMLARAFPWDSFLTFRVLSNQLEACPIQFPCYYLLS